MDRSGRGDDSGGQNGMNSSGNEAPGGRPGQPSDLSTMSRTERMRQLSAERERRMRQLKEGHEHYLPEARQQVDRVFSEYSPPFWAPGGRASRMEALSTGVALLATQNRQSLTDEQVKVVGDQILAVRNFKTAWSELGWAVAGWFTFFGKGSQSFKFPFYQPTYGFRFNPITGGRPVQMAWNVARFMAYNLVWKFATGPPASVAFGMYELRQIREDPRTHELLKGVLQSQGAQPGFPNDQSRDMMRGGAPQSPEQYNWEQDQQDQSPQQSTWPRKETEAAWREESANTTTPSYSQANTSSPSYSQEPQQPIQRNAGWDSSSDDFDDASPVAASQQARQSSYGSSSGSSWDRIRQQAQGRQGQSPQPRDGPPQQQQQQWQRYQQQRSSESWGENAGTSPEYRGPRESYTYSEADSEKASAKNQAQREFDELVERERQGDDQGKPSSSWVRR